MMMIKLAIGCSVVLWIGCGGKTVVDPGGGGSGSTTTTSSTSTTGSTTSGSSTSTTTTGLCADHDDCPDGICIFSSGLCSPTCGLTDPCPKGQVCTDCATSSCPACEDCVSACLPAQQGQCDDYDDCDAGLLCVYGWQMCAEPCYGPDDCNPPDTYCEGCATGSCPGCADCVAACLPLLD